MRLVSTLLLLAAASPPAPDLLAMARAGKAPSFEAVLDARFAQAPPTRFEALRVWAEELSPEDRATYYIQAGPWIDGKPQWSERKPCGEADRTGFVRAMVVAAHRARDKAAAQAIWDEVERSYANAVTVERARLAAAAIEARRRPTPVGKALALRVASDQAWRETQIDRDHDDVTEEAISWRFWSRECHIDDDDTRYLKGVVAAGKWPITSRDGAAAADDAWVLAQHADSDPGFQEQVLALMEPLVSRKEGSGKNYALMFDRVAVARDHLQRYGTQFRYAKGGCLAVSPVEDHAGLDARRATMGLSSLADYAHQLEAGYHHKACGDLFDTSKADPQKS